MPGVDEVELALGQVAADVAHRLDEAVALVGGEVVLADVVGKRIALDGGRERAGDDLPGVGAPVPVEVGGLDPILQGPAERKRERRAAAPDDKAA